MNLTNIPIKQNPHKCEGLAVVVTETNKPATLLYVGHKPV